MFALLKIIYSYKVHVIIVKHWLQFDIQHELKKLHNLKSSQVNRKWKNCEIYGKIQLIYLNSYKYKEGKLYRFLKRITQFLFFHFCAKIFQCVLVVLILDLSLHCCSIWIKKQIVGDEFRFSKSSSNLKEKCFTVLSSNNLIWLLLWNPGIQH